MLAGLMHQLSLLSQCHCLLPHALCAWLPTFTLANLSATAAMGVASCRDPLSQDPPAIPFGQAIQPGAMPLPRRVAWSATLGRASPVEPEVASICEQAAFWFSSIGAEVVESWPDMSLAGHLFQVRLTVNAAFDLSLGSVLACMAYQGADYLLPSRQPVTAVPHCCCRL